MKKFLRKYREAKILAKNYCGIFKINMYLMYLFPKKYAKWLVHSRQGFNRGINCKCVQLYHLGRYGFSLMEDTEDTRPIISEVAQWTVDDGHMQLLPTLEDIFVTGNTLNIVTLRPGLWIGKSGSVIDSLTERLRKFTGDDKFTVNLIETMGGVYEFMKAYESYRINYCDC